MTTAALVIWAYGDSTTAPNPERVAWLKTQRDALVASQFGGGSAAASLINAAGAGKTAGFQIDLSGPDKLEVLTQALIDLGAVPAVAEPVIMTHAGFANLIR